MSTKRKFSNSNPPKSNAKKSNRSWKAVTTALKLFEEGKYEETLSILLEHEDCEVRGMLLLAYMYFNGIGVAEDIKKSVGYLRNIIEFDDVRDGEEGILAEAFYRLGEFHYGGVVLEKDDFKAERLWYQGATIKSESLPGRHHPASVQCQTALGMFYSNPEKDDIKKAFDWHKKANDSGSMISEGALGVMYMYGIGTEKNLENAYEYLLNSAVQGYIYAKGYLTAFYYDRQMYERSVYFGRELAAEEDYSSLAKSCNCPIDHIKRGVALGCFYFALCCHYGYATAKNTTAARSLIIKAVELSPELAYDTHVKAILGLV